MRLAIIGTRSPTRKQIEFADVAAEYAISLEHEIATGAAEGIDAVAIEAAERHKRVDLLHIYLPWSSFNSHLVPGRANVYVYTPGCGWEESVYRLHPFSGELKPASFKLHARNYGIVAGADAVLALPGQEYGGTNQGMRIAQDLAKPLRVITQGDSTCPAEIFELIEG